MLRFSEIERKPKPVERARSYRISVKLSVEQIEHVEEILSAVENGTQLPHWAYRADHQTTPDLLLQEMGIMHLHIGSKASRELVYLVQFSDRVVLLEISDHGQFRDEPRGTILKQMHHAILQEIARAEADEALRAAEAVLLGQERKKRQLAEGVARLKARRTPPDSTQK